MLTKAEQVTIAGRLRDEKDTIGRMTEEIGNAVQSHALAWWLSAARADIPSSEFFKAWGITIRRRKNTCGGRTFKLAGSGFEMNLKVVGGDDTGTDERLRAELLFYAYCGADEILGDHDWRGRAKPSAARVASELGETVKEFIALTATERAVGHYTTGGFAGA